MCHSHLKPLSFQAPRVSVSALSMAGCQSKGECVFCCIVVRILRLPPISPLLEPHRARLRVDWAERALCACWQPAPAPASSCPYRHSCGSGTPFLAAPGTSSWEPVCGEQGLSRHCRAHTCLWLFPRIRTEDTAGGQDGEWEECNREHHPWKECISI